MVFHDETLALCRFSFFNYERMCLLGHRDASFFFGIENGYAAILHCRHRLSLVPVSKWISARMEQFCFMDRTLGNSKRAMELRLVDLRLVLEFTLIAQCVLAGSVETPLAFLKEPVKAVFGMPLKHRNCRCDWFQKLSSLIQKEYRVNLKGFSMLSRMRSLYDDQPYRVLAVVDQ